MPTGPIPANAGETDGVETINDYDGAYPRERGGNGSVAFPGELEQGLSPRTRGKHPILSRAKCCSGPIPANAGET